MQDAPATPSAQSAQPTPEEHAAESRRSQAITLDPVTFQAFGAGAQTVPGNPGMVMFSFPVHHAKVVRIAAEYATACQFTESLVETLGGWDAVRARGRHTKRRIRR